MKVHISTCKARTSIEYLRSPSHRLLNARDFMVRVPKLILWQNEYLRGWVRGYGGVGLWEAGPGCACCEDYD